MQAKPRKFHKTRLIPVAAAVLLLGAAGAMALFWYGPFRQAPAASPAIEALGGVGLPDSLSPEERGAQKQERAVYDKDSMVLTIDRLGLSARVGDTTSEADLMKGPGLYEYAQMPGLGDRNTSIAGHRDLYDKCFYSIDKLTQGDKIYLDYGGFRYTYDYYATRIVESDDWSVIARQGYSCVTLTSCHPIGTSRRRIVVTGILSDIEQLPAA